MPQIHVPDDCAQSIRFAPSKTWAKTRDEAEEEEEGVLKNRIHLSQTFKHLLSSNEC